MLLEQHATGLYLRLKIGGKQYPPYKVGETGVCGWVGCEFFFGKDREGKKIPLERGVAKEGGNRRKGRKSNGKKSLNWICNAR